MNRSLVGSLFLILLSISSCSVKKNSNATISGMISEAPGQTLVLQELDLENSTALDSVTLNGEGKFSFSVQVKKTGLYMLRLPKLAPLVLEVNPGDSIKILGSFKFFPGDVTIEGSGNSLDLLGFLNASDQNEKKFDSLEILLISHQEDPDFAKLSDKLDELLKPLWENQRALEITYIEDHPASLTSLLALNHGLSTSPLLTFEDDSIYFLKLDSSLNKAFPGNKHVDFHHKRIIQARELQGMKRHSK